MRGPANGLKRHTPTLRDVLPSLSLALMLLTFGCARTATTSPAEAKKRVVIAASRTQANAPIFVAQSKGFFGEEGLQPVILKYPSGKTALAAALAGKADFATAAETPIVRSILDGGEPRLIATIAESKGTNLIVARKDRGIVAAGDLKGKRVGLVVGTTSEFFLYVYLVSSGIEPAQVTTVPLETDRLVPALMAGQVDAIAAFAPYTFEAVDTIGANGTTLDNPGIYTETWNVVVRQAGSVDGDVTQRFLRAIFRARAFMEDHPKQAQAITARETGLAPATVGRVWGNVRWETKLDQGLLLTMEDEARWMSPGEKVPDVLRYIDTEDLKKVSPTSMRMVEHE